MPADSRERMVASAALLFREQGYSGTGFREVVAHSGAPRGSIYHHFPGGKTELAQEAVALAGAVAVAGIERAMADGDPVEGLRRYVDLWRRTLTESDFRAGCPIVAVTVEAHETDVLARASDEAFTSIEDRLADALRRAGASRSRAASLSVLILASVEGAVIRCRAQRSLAPLDEVAAELERAVAEATA